MVRSVPDTEAALAQRLLLQISKTDIHTTRNRHPFDNQKNDPKICTAITRRETANSILIVDDTEFIVHLLAHFLGELADEIEVARDGGEAVSLIANSANSANHYDVVMMDLQMPVKSGLQAAREVRDRGIDIPMIAMSAGEFSVDQTSSAGFDGYASKPFDRSKLAEFVSDFIE